LLEGASITSPWEDTMRRRITPSMAISLLALFVALGGVGYSATGGNFILGATNEASTPSVLSSAVPSNSLLINNPSTYGGATALRLVVLSGHPPLSTNSQTKVVNLNADFIDNIDGGKFLRAGVATTATPSGNAAGVVDVTNAGASNGIQGKTAYGLASGVYGENTGTAGYGVAGRAKAGGFAIFGDNTGGGTAGEFHGDVHVTGSLHCAGCVGASDISGKVDDADRLDGMDSSAFIQGGGKAGGQAVAIAAGTNLWLGNPLLGFLRLIYACPATLANNGTFAFNNDSGSVANVFVESGGDNPAYYQMQPGDQVQFAAAATGDSWHIQAQGALGILTIEAASVHRSASNDCHVQAQGVLTSG
jgi:hypothetical protein